MSVRGESFERVCEAFRSCGSAIALLDVSCNNGD